MINDLYHELILDHNKSPRNQKPLSNVTHHTQGCNPLCGDKISLSLYVRNNTICDVSFKSEGCALSVAAASIMTEIIKGLLISEVMELARQFHDMLTKDGEIIDGKLAAFAGVKNYPGRVKCVTMSWHTLKSALKDTEY